jgi:two-component system, sensor histidine kinase ChiS
MKEYLPRIFVLVFVISCNPKTEQARHTAIAPKVMTAKGYIVPKDSVSEPKIIPIDEQKLIRVPVGEPTVVPTNTNLHPAGIPKIVSAGIPRVIYIGQDTFSLPKTVPAIHKPFKETTPEVVIAKDPSQMDLNPQSFSSLSKLQGLKDGAIVCMLEDTNGNLWISTQLGGVSKYDGKSFSHLALNEASTFGHVTCMLEDKEGNIWFGTAYDGISKYDGRFVTHFTKKEGLIDNQVQSMLEDRSGNLWFGTGAGVSKLSVDRKSFTHFTKKEGLSGTDIRSILEDKHGNIWFGTGGGGVTRFNRERKAFSHFTVNEGLPNNWVISIAEDRNGNLWFSNPSGGVSRLSGDYNSFANFTEKEGLINNWVRTIFEDKIGNIWFGHLDEGACRLSKDGTSFAHFTKKEGLNDTDVRSILEDRHGNLWFGTYEGVSKYRGNSFSHFTDADGLSNNYVWSILEDKNGNLWFGHDSGGVSRLDSDRKSFARLAYLRGMSVWAILEDKSGNLWFGTVNNGLIQLSRDRKYFTHFLQKDGLSSNHLLSMLEDKAGNLWIGTIDGGVSRISEDRKTFTNYTEKEGLINNFVSSITEDNNGNLWFATAGGVSRLNRDGRSFTDFTDKDGLSDIIVWAALTDNGGNLWFGTNDGLSRLSSDERFFTHFTEKDGLSNSSISAMHKDKSGNLWLSTPFGINKLSKEKSETISGNGQVSGQVGSILFKTFTHEDGFLGVGGLANSIFEDRNGNIWTGANNRLTAYHPEGDVADTIPPNIQLTGVAMFNENIVWSRLEENKDTSLVLGNGVTLSDFSFDGVSNWYFLPKNLSLAHHNNNLTFSFTGITLKSPQKVKYQFKLEGNDENWSSLTTQSDAHYGNLPPGAYTFRLKAMNSEGYWSKELTYGFIIRPPWWKTSWAYMAYGSMLIGIFLSWRSYDIKRVKLKHRAEHLSELDTLKTRFFANISHEFRTPITLILGPLKELYNEADNEEQKSLLGTMMRNGQRLLRLVNQLLDLSRLEAGKLKIQASHTEVVQFLREIASSYESLAAQNKIRFSFYAEIEELHMSLDQEKIEKVVHNILSNAFKFTTENGAVSLNLRADNNQQAIISVSDTGIGIPSDQLNHVFDRFYQVDNSQTREYEGSGIGMALAKELVELHQGTITLESEFGKGSTFTVRLPLDKKYGPEEGAALGEASGERKFSNEIISERLRSAFISTSRESASEAQSILLIVEDNGDMRNYIARTLGEEYQIVEAKNGKEGMEKASELLPDLIISDIMMPEMDGYKLCELIKTKEITSHIPVILLTAKADQQSRITGLEQRADDYLLKPFEAEELRLIVRNHIEAQKKMREKFSKEITLEPKQISLNSLDEKFLQKVLAIIEAHIEDEDFSIEDFSHEAGYSRMQLYRKLTSLAGQTPSQFVRTIRLKRAAQMLTNKTDNVTQIAYSVGFNSLAYFSKCFKDQFGVTPGQFADKEVLKLGSKK